MESLNDLRKSIDNIDNAIIAMLAERFKITNQVGYYKAKENLPPKDLARESKQYQRISELAETYGLDAEIAQSYLSNIIARVIDNHESISKEVNNQDK